MDIQNILILENQELYHIKCYVCFKNFINVKGSKYSNWIRYIQNKYFIVSRDFHSSIKSIDLNCYDEKFNCMFCKSIICKNCIYNSENTKVVFANYSQCNNKVNRRGYGNGHCILNNFEIQSLKNIGYENIENMTDEEYYRLPNIRVNDTIYYGFYKNYRPHKCVICDEYNILE